MMVLPFLWIGSIELYGFSAAWAGISCGAAIL
jgi:hypothetical protein